MDQEITISNESFWTWVSSLIEGGESDCINFMSRMIDERRYFANETNTLNPSSDFSMFCHLKKVMPKDYFREMEYCALAYSTIFEKLFPPLSKHIEQLAYIEWLCYMEPEHLNYRDHFVHMLKVAFVCHVILSSSKAWSDNIMDWQFNSEHFSNWCTKQKIHFSDREKNNIINTAVFLSSIFHDFGYGYRFLRRYEEKLFKLNLLGCDSIDITKKRADIIKRSLLGKFILCHHEWSNKNRNLSDNQEENTLLGFVRDCLPLNHSVASSLVVLDIADELYYSQIIDPELYIAFQIAAEACLIHDLTDPRNYLHLSHISNAHKHFLDFNSHKKVPIAMLLIFADELSMWNRPLIEFESSSNDIQNIKIHHNRWKYNKNIDTGHIKTIDTEYPKTIKIDLNEEQSEIKVLLENSSQVEILEDVLKECNCFNIEQDNILKIFDCEIKFS